MAADITTTNGQETIAIRLRDGSIANLRPLIPADKKLLIEGLKQMSPESIRARFGVVITSFSQAELEYLTTLDQVDHVAWGAVVDGHPAGTARYIRHNGDDTAEIAVTVIDRYQRRGLGRALFDAVCASARYNGIRQLMFSVTPDNEQVLRMVRGLEIRLAEGEGLLEGGIPLDDIGPAPFEVEIAELLRQAQLGAS